MSYSDLADTFRRRAIEFSPLKARVLFDFGDGGAILVDASASPPEIHEETGEADCTIRVTATLLARDHSGAYRYLPRSVATFHDRESFTHLLTEAGFESVRMYPLTFGVCVVYLALAAE